MRFARRVLWLAGDVLGVLGLIVVCLADEVEARRARLRPPEVWPWLAAQPAPVPDRDPITGGRIRP